MDGLAQDFKVWWIAASFLFAIKEELTTKQRSQKKCHHPTSFHLTFFDGAHRLSTGGNMPPLSLKPKKLLSSVPTYLVLQHQETRGISMPKPHIFDI